MFVGAEAQRERAVAFEDYSVDQESCCRKIEDIGERLFKGCYGVRVQVQIAVVNSRWIYEDKGGLARTTTQ